jgi:hypothetical protein
LATYNPITSKKFRTDEKSPINDSELATTKVFVRKYAETNGNQLI